MTKLYYTQNGIKIHNPDTYANTGAPMFETDSIHDTMNINKKTYIYKLKLECGKIYIGKTGNIEKRMKQHFSGNGSMVTKKYKPLNGKILDSCPGYFGNEIEQLYTNSYIVKYGYSNVRGGKYTNSQTLDLIPEEDKKIFNYEDYIDEIDEQSNDETAK